LITDPKFAPVRICTSGVDAHVLRRNWRIVGKRWRCVYGDGIDLYCSARYVGTGTSRHCAARGVDIARIKGRSELIRIVGRTKCWPTCCVCTLDLFAQWRRKQFVGNEPRVAV